MSLFRCFPSTMIRPFRAIFLAYFLASRRVCESTYPFRTLGAVSYGRRERFLFRTPECVNSMRSHVLNPSHPHAQEEKSVLKRFTPRLPPAILSASTSTVESPCSQVNGSSYLPLCPRRKVLDSPDSGQAFCTTQLLYSKVTCIFDNPSYYCRSKRRSLLSPLIIFPSSSTSS